jgi:subtilisin family serine protease
MSRHPTKVLLLALAALLPLAGCRNPVAVPPAGAPAEGGPRAGADDELLVKTADYTDPAGIDRLVPGRRLETLRFGGHAYLRYRLEEGRSPEEAIASIAGRPGVEAAEKNYIYRHFRVPDDAGYGNQYAPWLAGCETAWESYTGSGSVVVAVVDTGVNAAHEDLGSGRFVEGWNFVTPLDESIQPGDNSDDNGHGTHVAGIIGAQGDNGTGIAGVAWQTGLMAVKVLDSEGYGLTSDIAAGIVWAADHYANVINLSLGGPGYSVVMADAVQYALGQGVVVVAAAGNDGCSTLNYPAGCSGVIAVASTNARDGLSSYSTRGRFLSVAAPGESIYSLSHLGTGGYLVMSGTSMAAPFVCGAAALLLQKDSALTPAQVKTILEDTAADRGAVGYDREFGYGRVDVAAALAQSTVVERYGTILVQVLNGLDPVAALEVLLLDADGGYVVRSALTSDGGMSVETGVEAGVAELAMVPAGTYQVSVFYLTELYVGTVAVTAGSTVEHTVQFPLGL